MPQTHQPRDVVAAHLRLCESLPWDDVSAGVAGAAGEFTSRIARLVSLGPEQHSACPICGKEWIHRQGHNVAAYHRPRS
jgi:hypothetical protein